MPKKLSNEEKVMRFLNKQKKGFAVTAGVIANATDLDNRNIKTSVLDKLEAQGKLVMFKKSNAMKSSNVYMAKGMMN